MEARQGVEHRDDRAHLLDGVDTFVSRSSMSREAKGTNLQREATATTDVDGQVSRLAANAKITLTGTCDQLLEFPTAAVFANFRAKEERAGKEIFVLGESSRCHHHRRHRP